MRARARPSRGFLGVFSGGLSNFARATRAKKKKKTLFVLFVALSFVSPNRRLLVAISFINGNRFLAKLLFVRD